MTLLSEMLADAPSGTSGIWMLADTSTALLDDASPDGHDGSFVVGSGSIAFSQASIIPTVAGTCCKFSPSARGVVSYGSWMNANSFTAFGWMDTTGNLTGFRHLAARRGAAGDVFFFGLDSGKPTIYVWRASGLVNYAAASALSAGVHYLGVSVTATTAKVYADNVEVISATFASSTIVTPSSELTIAERYNGGEPVAANTKIQAAGYYAGVAISAARHLAYYNAGLDSSATATLAGVVQAKTAAFTALGSATASLAGTVQPKVASFAAGAVVSAALAGTVQQKVAAFAVETPAVDAALAGVVRPKVAAFNLLADGSATLAGTVQQKTVAFALAGEADVALAGVVQPKVASFAASMADRIVSLAGVVRPKTAAFTVAAQPALRLAGVVRPKVAAFTAETLPTVAMAGVVQRKIATFTAYVVTPVTTPPLLAQQGAAVVVGRAFGPVTMNGAQPVYTISQAAIPRARQRLLVDGKDVTYFRDVITPAATYTLLEPLLYGPGQIDFPQISAAFETLGVGALSWLRPGAPVEIQRVLDDVVIGTDYKGVIVAFDKSGRDLSVELGGEASGRAALRDREGVIFPRVNDLGHQIADAIRDLGLPHYPALGTVTGIEVQTTGGVGFLEHIQGLVANAWTRAGKHWTVMPNEATGVYGTHQKDETTVHATAFLDDTRTVATLRRDVAEEPNRIFITGVTPQGQRVRFGVYPGLIQGDPPPFPGHMENGDTGPGVRLLIGRLQGVGYLRLEDVAGGYDFDVIEAVNALQNDAGLPETGEVNEATWNALYDLEITTPSLTGAHIEPAAQRRAVREKFRSGSGIVIGFNDDYDPEILVSDRTIDAGVGKTRSQLREFARTVLHDADSANWVGDIKFNTGALLRGNVAIGATVTEADVLDGRELRPGNNINLPGFEGGILVHVSACQIDDEGMCTASVDTRFRDAMEVWDIIERNKESKNDPARRRNQKHRSSTIRKDSIGEWDEIGGRLGQDIHLMAGWNTFWVVAAMEGTIARFQWTLEIPMEHVVAVFGREVDRGFMDDVIGPPLTENGKRNWRRAAPKTRLKDRWILVSFGTPDEPCGYGADIKGDGAPLTGELDEGDFPYRSEDRSRLWVAAWVPEENTIPLGRIMWPQLEAGA